MITLVATTNVAANVALYCIFQYLQFAIDCDRTLDGLSCIATRLDDSVGRILSVNGSAKNRAPFQSDKD